MSEDAELLHRYTADRDETAFAELVRRHINLVYSVALRRVDGRAHLAGDVTQGVFTDLARKAPSLAGHAVLAAWLFTSARYAAAQVMRTERRRQLREQEAHTMQELLGHESAPAEWEKLRPVLDDVLDQLDARDREAILLRFYEGQPFAGVGAALRLSEDAARMRVDRALDRLRALLAKRDITSTSAALAAVLANQAAATAPAGLAVSVTGAALASADGVAATALGILQFMSTTKFALGAAAILGFLALGTAGYRVHAQREAQASLAAANRAYAALTARLRDLGQRVQITSHEVAGLQNAVDGRRTAIAASRKNPTPTASETAFQAALIAGNAFLEKHSDIEPALTEKARAQVAGQFGQLYRSLRLSPAQIEKFESLMFERNPTDDAYYFRWSGKDRMLHVGTGAAPEDAERGLRELLGDEGFRQFQQAERTLPARTLAVDLARALHFSDAPLTTMQAEQLVRLVAEIPASVGTPAGDLDWSKILTQAPSVLSPPQLAALQALQVQSQLDQAVKHAATLGKKS